MYAKYKIKLITLKEAEELMAMFDDEDLGMYMPLELFLWKEGDKWIAMDNTDGNAWIEEFSARWKAERWLVGA